MRRIADAVLRSRMVRYLAAAVVGAAVDVSTFAILIYGAGVDYLWAGVAGFVLATMANYVVSIRIVFASGTRFPRLMEIAVVYAVSASGLVWHQLILWYSVEHAGIHVMLGKFIAIGTVFFWNYFLRRRFVFARVTR